MEHTPKNLLIRAVKTGKEKPLDKTTAMMKELHVKPTLMRLLSPEGDERAQRENNMKKLVRRFLLLLVIFILGVTGTALLLNNETTDDRSDMNNATLPEVMVEFDGVLANRMYGYREPMQVDFTRDSITPVDTTKKLTLVVNPYGTKVKSLSYEVRTLMEAR